MNAPERTPAPPKLPGVIDTLTAGYKTLNRHPYLLLLPIILDLFYWLGPRLSMAPLAQQFAQYLEQVSTTSSTLSVTTAQSAQSVDMLKTMVVSMGQSLNLFSLLSSPLSVPSILSSLDLKTPAWIGGEMIFTVTSSTQFFSLFLLLFALGVLVGAVYMGLAAQVVRDGRGQLVTVIRHAGTYASRFLLLVLALLVTAMFIGLPVGLLFSFVTLLSPLLGTLLFMALSAAILWLYLFAFFTISALFVSEARPLEAVLRSITVVRLSTSSALGLLLIIVIISLGMSYVWTALGSSDAATALSILGNAYIGTGLTIASMIFYRDRIAAVVSSQTPAVRRQ